MRPSHPLRQGGNCLQRIGTYAVSTWSFAKMSSGRRWRRPEPREGSEMARPEAALGQRQELGIMQILPYRPCRWLRAASGPLAFGYQWAVTAASGPNGRPGDTSLSGSGRRTRTALGRTLGCRPQTASCSGAGPGSGPGCAGRCCGGRTNVKAPLGVLGRVGPDFTSR